jgi:hypothetical protein
MNPLVYYRFGAYTVTTMGLINMPYQIGLQGNFVKSLFLVLVGVVIFVLTLVPFFKSVMLKTPSKLIAGILFLTLIIYGFLI